MAAVHTIDIQETLNAIAVEGFTAQSVFLLFLQNTDPFLPKMKGNRNFPTRKSDSSGTATMKDLKTGLFAKPVNSDYLINILN